MKKEYVKPSIKIIKDDCEEYLITGSNNYMPTPPDRPDDDPGHKPWHPWHPWYTKENNANSSLWDEEW